MEFQLFSKLKKKKQKIIFFSYFFDLSRFLLSNSQIFSPTTKTQSTLNETIDKTRMNLKQVTVAVEFPLLTIF
jgi:hypothetical protein